MKTNGFSIQEVKPSIGYWELDGVLYRDKNIKVKVSKELIPSMTQDEHAQLRKEIIRKNTKGFYAADLPLNHAVSKTAFLNKDHPNIEYRKKIEDFRQFLKEKILNTSLLTLSRIVNKAEGKDIVIHNYKQEDEYRALENIVGPDQLINQNFDRNVLKTLSGSDNPYEFNEIYKWITENNDIYIFRINNHPKKDLETVARFYGNPDRSVLNCYGDPANNTLAFWY